MSNFLVLSAAGLRLRNVDESAGMTAEQGGSTDVVSAGPLPAPANSNATPLPHHRRYDQEHARMEAWLDENPDFVQDYFMR